jgi:hypothetical protein
VPEISSSGTCNLYRKAVILSSTKVVAFFTWILQVRGGQIAALTRGKGVVIISSKASRKWTSANVDFYASKWLINRRGNK